MNSTIAQAAKLTADYIYKKEILGIDICLDERVFDLVNKNSMALCDYTVDCEIKEVTLPTFNTIKTCSSITIADETASTSSCTPITTESQCTYTVEGIKQYPNRIVINGTTLSFSAYNLATELDAFESFVKTFLDSQDFALSIVSVSGSYNISITSTSDIISIRAGDDVAGANNTVYVFNKDCRL